MGWNTLDVAADHPLLEGIPAGRDGWHAYFVHSYALMNAEPGELVAETDYGGPVTAIVARRAMSPGPSFTLKKARSLASG